MEKILLFVDSFSSEDVISPIKMCVFPARYRPVGRDTDWYDLIPERILALIPPLFMSKPGSCHSHGIPEGKVAS